MNNPKLLKIFLPLVIALGAGLWWATSVQVRSTGTKSFRQDSPQSILEHVRTANSPLVLVNFWASWCEPCKEEMPALKELKKLYSDKGLKIILVSIDDAEDLDAAVQYLRENDMDFTTFYKGAQSLKFVSQIYPQWTGAVPASVLFNPELKILDAWEGDSSLEELQQRVQKQLRGS